MHQRTAHHPTKAELLAVIQDEGETAEFYDSIGDLADEEQEAQFMRLLGYNPTIV